MKIEFRLAMGLERGTIVSSFRRSIRPRTAITSQRTAVLSWMMTAPGDQERYADRAGDRWKQSAWRERLLAQWQAVPDVRCHCGHRGHDVFVQTQ
jgi:hypothetical protein